MTGGGGDVDLRKLRYFLAVARCGTFGRAAVELHIAQPVLSRQVRALETELGATLLIRGSRGTRVTEAGAQLVVDGERLIAAAADLRRRVAGLANPPGSFTIAFMPGIAVSETGRQLRDAHPGLVVELMRTGYDDQTAVVRDGRADVAYLRPPFESDGVTARPLCSERRVVALPLGHPLARRSALDVSELVDEHLLQLAESVPGWPGAGAGPDAGSDQGPSAALGRPVPTVEEKLERVALGEGVVALAESMADHYRHPAVVFIPVDGIDPAEVHLAWSSRSPSPLVAEYAALAFRHHRRPSR